MEKKQLGFESEEERTGKKSKRKGRKIADPENLRTELVFTKTFMQ